jgi:hypothetical protein
MMMMIGNERYGKDRTKNKKDFKNGVRNVDPPINST